MRQVRGTARSPWSPATTRGWLAPLGVSLVVAASFVVTEPASGAVPDYSSKGKGAVGGALLGAEFFIGAEALLGVQAPWVYGAGALAGGLGGGFGGHYLERGVTEQTTMLVVTAGMLLVIPSAVVVMSATAYHSPREAVEDTGPIDEPPAETAPQDESSRSALRHSPTGQPTRPAASVVALSPSGLCIGLPAVSIRDVWNREQQSVWGVESATEIQFELFHWSF